MSFSPLPTIAQDTVVNIDYLNQIKANEDDHEARLSDLGTSDIPNGSFESFNPVSPYDPINWTWGASGNGGTHGTQSSTSMHGGRELWITHPGGSGNGGGNFESGYTPCAEISLLVMHWIHRATAAGMHNLVEVRWFDKAKSYLSATTVYDSQANPTSALTMLAVLLPPAGARFFKVRVWGGKSDVTTGGTAYFDGFGISRFGYGGRVGVPTLAEQGQGAASWTDSGSVVLPLHVAANTYLSYFAFTGDLKAYVNGALYAYQRFRIGSLYSNETAQQSASYASYRYALSGLITSAGQLTLTQQLYTSSAGYTCYGRISAPDARVLLAA